MRQWHARPKREGYGRYNASPTTDLREYLCRLQDASYGAYKSLENQKFSVHLDGDSGFELCITHVQADSYAPPSDITLVVPIALIPPVWPVITTATRYRAFCDFVYRRLYEAIGFGHRNTEDGFDCFARKTAGEVFHLDKPSQHILSRSAVVLEQSSLVAKLHIALPGRGRRIEGSKAALILTNDLPRILRQVIGFTVDEVRACCDFVEDQVALRNYLASHGLVAFVANGAVLPRLSGASDEPLRPQEDKATVSRRHRFVPQDFDDSDLGSCDDGRYGHDDIEFRSAVPFQSPPSLEVTIPLPHKGEIKGLGIKEGVTLIVGGGFHGKSTLLRALQLGIYDKVANDGREFVAAVPSTVKVRAEDGRPITGVDLSLFIHTLPGNRSTVDFKSTNASGSTSQAAFVMESIEAGAKLLLFDEDTSAANFMHRSEQMRKLVAPADEPIRNYLMHVKALYTALKISSIIVVGSSSDYFAVADCVIQMKNFQALDVTARARELAGATAPECLAAVEGDIRKCLDRPRGSLYVPRNLAESKVQVDGLRRITFRGELQIDLTRLEQFVERGQLRIIAGFLRHIGRSRSTRQTGSKGISIEELGQWWERFEVVYNEPGDEHDRHERLVSGSFPKQAECLQHSVVADFSQVRWLDFMAALNRCLIHPEVPVSSIQR